MIAERTDLQIGCLAGRFLDATFELTDDELALAATAAHPVDAVHFAGQHLARVER